MTIRTREDLPAQPQIHAVVRADGSAEISVGGMKHPITASTTDEARIAVLRFVWSLIAAPQEEKVLVEIQDPQGDRQYLVSPDGKVHGTASDVSLHVPVETPPRWLSVVSEPLEQQDESEPRAGSSVSKRKHPTLDDLLASRPASRPGPAQMGWQATAGRLSGGRIRLRPGAAELNRRKAIASVQRSLDGPKTIVVINPKGGANKTTAALLIAATFGIHRGGYTLAWDNNETRGTLGWRANPARHDNTAVDLLRDLDRFSEHSAGRVGDLDNYVRSQGSAQFDVLASDEDAASAASIDADGFDRLHATLSRFYRVMLVDTGNNMRASNWEAAVAAADQLVIVSTIREDTAQSAAWLVDALRAIDNHRAVRKAVTVLTAASHNPDPELSKRLHDHFGKLTRVVLDVPYDPALVAGGPVEYDALTDATRDAWLQVSAAIARRL